MARAKRTQGMNWIRPEKRLALYLRDGLACCYCGASVEQGIRLTLDHLRPYANGGTNNATNLVTCCSTCNSSRGKRSWREFAQAAANYLDHGITGKEIVEHIEKTRRHQLGTAIARQLLARRGNFSSVLQNIRTSATVGG